MLLSLTVGPDGGRGVLAMRHVYNRNSGESYWETTKLHRGYSSRYSSASHTDVLRVRWHYRGNEERAVDHHYLIGEKHHSAEGADNMRAEGTDNMRLLVVLSCPSGTW